MTGTDGHVGLDDLVLVKLGPLNLLAPDPSPRHVRGTHGDLWQWFGSGRDLITLTVAVRRTQIGTARGIHDHTLWEIDRLIKSFDSELGTPAAIKAPARISGSVGAGAAIVDGIHTGVRTHNRIVVASDGKYMHVVHAMTPDTDPGRLRASALVDDLAVTDWKDAP